MGLPAYSRHLCAALMLHSNSALLTDADPHASHGMYTAGDHQPNPQHAGFKSVASALCRCPVPQLLSLQLQAWRACRQQCSGQAEAPRCREMRWTMPWSSLQHTSR